MSVRLTGTMNPDLKWATFEGTGSLMPITVVFFNNKTWSDTSQSEFYTTVLHVWFLPCVVKKLFHLTDAIQPQFALPLLVPAKDRKTVTFTCTAFGFLPIHVRLVFKICSMSKPKTVDLLKAGIDA